MKMLEWSDSYSVGIAEIDEQHKALFAMIGRLHEAILNKEGSTVCRSILDELVEYTRVHFALEQTLMRVGKYPDYDKHCQLHHGLVDEVESLQKKIASGQAAISFELLHFLRNWLTTHILNEDMKYGKFFQKSADGDVVGTWTEQSRSAREKQRKKSVWWKFW
jgi:hemerythrin